MGPLGAPRSGGTPPRGGRSAPPTPGHFSILRGAAPLCAPQSGGTPPHPHGWAYPAHTRGSFRFTTKGTKGVPGLRPWTLPVQNVRPHWRCAAACTRATFYHKPRPICHFGLVGKSVFVSPQALPGVTPSAVNPWRGRWSCGLRAARSGTPFWGERQSRWGDDNAPPQGEYPEGAPLWEILW